MVTNDLFSLITLVMTDGDDLLRYERSASTDVLPHRLASHNERFHKGLVTMDVDKPKRQ